MEADAFVRWIVKSLNVKCLIVGDDFRFGHNRAGDHRLLSAMAGELGYELIEMCIRDSGWEAQYGIKEMCADSWRWQKNNPNGYDD